jgi:low affinity Fe/Cu permease
MPLQKETITSTFISKLKEQSFTIILLLGIIYYQNMMWNNDHKELQTRIEDLDKQIKESNARERALYVDKENSLTKQREEFLKILHEKFPFYQVPLLNNE